MTDPGNAKRIVVKVGTNTLTGPDGAPDLWYLSALADDVAALRAEGREVILVSSGAIGAGVSALGMTERPREVRLRQAAAAVGQSRLMQAWDAAFARRGIPVAQLLLTTHAFNDRQTYLNLRNATEALLELGVVPVVNENDTISVEEITDLPQRARDHGGADAATAGFGDNDRLSALVASKVEADALIILSDVAGLFTRPPGKPGAKLVEEVRGTIPEDVRHMADAKATSGGRGGMLSKLESAQLAMDAGVTVVIASGREPHVVPRILAGEHVGTRFVPEGREHDGMKRWLAIAKPQGRVHVDAGAAAALKAHKHLLPAGVTRVEGAFEAEGVVDIVHDKRVIARAVSGLSAQDLDRVKGLHSDDARRRLHLVNGRLNVTRKGGILLLDE